jgi:hypothetical protein
MKSIIKTILKEEVDKKKESFEKKVINYLVGEGFTNTSSYSEVLKKLNNVFGITGMDAFEMYQLFKDNWGKGLHDKSELKRTDVSKMKVRSTNYKANELVVNKIPFKGNNTSAEYVNKSYVVYSYDWYPIFVYKDGQWFENENRYSVSTAKQMSRLRPYNQGNIISVSKNKLSEIIHGR